MKTLKDIEKEMQNRLGAVFAPLYTGKLTPQEIERVEADSAGFLTAALNRVAEETKKAVMPKTALVKEGYLEKFNPETKTRVIQRGLGHKSAVDEMEQNFKTFTEGV